MSLFTPTHRSPENQLLALLPVEEQLRLRPLLTPVELTQGEVLYDAGGQISQVHFVDQGMVSVVSLMEDGATIEVGTIGSEGLAGMEAILGIDSVVYRHNVQVAGRARRMSLASLAAELQHDRALRKVLLRYHAAFVVQTMQGMACNGLHSIEQRACRWLLTTQDRVDSQELNITHDFLAQMLGVRRASVTEVLRPLQDAGLIRATRGKVTLLDSKGLAANSCECYRVIRREYHRLLG